MRFTVGTYTRGYGATGLYLLEANADGGSAVCSPEVELDNPSWVTAHPRLPLLYSVVETADDGAGGIAVIDISDPHSMSVLTRFSSMGADPCHLVIARDMLIASNYSGGSLAAWRLDKGGAPLGLETLIQHSGSSVDPMRQRGPHVHSATYHEQSDSVFVCDLGVDRLFRYDVGRGVDVMSRKTARLKPGAGPRMMCIDPDGAFGYVINELDNTIVSFDLLSGDRPIELSTVSTLSAANPEPNYCAHVAMSDDGRFLYASNRGQDSIVVFAIGDSGALALLQHIDCGGVHPRFFLLFEDYLWVANRDSDCIAIFSRDHDTGLLEATGARIEVPAPVCILPLAD